MNYFRELIGSIKIFYLTFHFQCLVHSFGEHTAYE